MNRSIRIYSCFIAACFALAVGVSLLHGVPTLSVSKLAPLLAMAIVGEELVVLQRQRSGNPALSFSAPAHLAAALLVGALPAACIAALGVLIVDGLRQSSRRFLVLNASMFGLATWAGGNAYSAVVGSHQHLGAVTLPTLYGVVVLIGTRYLITSLILWGGHLLVTGRSALFVLGETLSGELESAVGEGALGVLIAIAFLPGHWIVFVLLVPLLGALYRSKSIFEQLKQETEEALDAVATVIDERHPTTAEHTERVAELVRRFVEAIELPQVESDRLVLAARFHDIGKIAVDVSTLSKDDKLSEEELAAIRRHPRLSARLLSPFHFAREIARYVEYHHERFDGRGYYSIRGEEIPIESHLLVAADSFDAMTSARPYRPALAVDEAVAELHDKSGTQFHPLIARAFAAVVSGEPVAAALDGAELRSLRRMFARRNRLSLHVDRLLPDPRLVTIGLASLALCVAGIRQVPILVPTSIAAAAVISAVVWFVTSASVERRRRLALTAIEAGATADVALATSGIARWFAWLDLDAEGVSHRLASGGGDAPPAELAEVCGWANRRRELVHTDLSSGRRLVLAAATGAKPRLALILDRRPSPRLEELCETICVSAATQPGPPSLRLVGEPAHDAGGLSALLVVELGAFDVVRKAAGQLLARRVVTDAERRLRALLRGSDEIRRLDDDSFSVSLRVQSERDLETVKRRMAEELAAIEMPGRTAPLAPRIHTASIQDAAEGLR